MWKVPTASNRDLTVRKTHLHPHSSNFQAYNSSNWSFNFELSVIKRHEDTDVQGCETILWKDIITLASEGPAWLSFCLKNSSRSITEIQPSLRWLILLTADETAAHCTDTSLASSVTSRHKGQCVWNSQHFRNWAVSNQGFPKIHGVFAEAVCSFWLN